MINLFWRLVAKLLARPAIAAWLIARAKRTPYLHIMSADGAEMYMGRWWLFNPYHDQNNQPIKRNWFMRLLPSIRIHEILLPDEDRHMHDHPWDAQTIILRGWYVEERENPEFDTFVPIHPYNTPNEVWLRHPGTTAPLRFGEFHRITGKSREPVVTMFITFAYRGTWGFKVDGEKIPFREYLAQRQNEDEA